MSLVPLRKVLDHAAANGYGVAAFNVNNMEQIQAIMEAANETDSPVIIQASRGARSYSQDAYLKHLMLAAAELVAADGLEQGQFEVVDAGAGPVLRQRGPAVGFCVQLHRRRPVNG